MYHTFHSTTEIMIHDFFQGHGLKCRASVVLRKMSIPTATKPLENYLKKTRKQFNFQILQSTGQTKVDRRVQADMSVSF